MAKTKKGSFKKDKKQGTLVKTEKKELKVLKAINKNLQIGNGVYWLLKKPRIHKFTRALLGQTSAATGGFGVGSGSGTGITVGNPAQVITFDITKLPNYTEFSSLFSQYRITKVTMIARYITSPTTATDPEPTLYIFKNHLYALTSGTITAAYIDQLDKVKVLNCSSDNNTISMSVKPWTAGYMTTTGTANPYHQYDQWMDFGYPTVYYFCFGVLCRNYASGAQIEFDYTVDFECKTLM